MWGINCSNYIKEVYRILDVGGILLISEPYKRWNSQIESNNGTIIINNRLIELLKKNKFKIINNEEKKFMFIECMKCE